MESIRIGNPVVVKWAFYHTDGTPFPIANYSVELFYYTGRGKTKVTDTSVIETEGNLLVWHFNADAQPCTGNYSLSLKVFNEGNLVGSFDRKEVFALTNMGVVSDNPVEVNISSKSDYIPLDQAIQNARLAADQAVEAAAGANGAADRVDTAITTANAAAENANTKAGLADTAANNANTKAELANTKAGLADTAAQNADAKAALANTAAQNADNVASSIAIEVGDVETGAPGSDVEVDGTWNPTTHKLSLDFSIPQGNPGTTLESPIQVVDNLTSTDGTTSVLSANQGRVLKGMIDANEVVITQNTQTGGYDITVGGGTPTNVVGQEVITKSFNKIEILSENLLNPAACQKGFLRATGETLTTGYDSYAFTDFMEVEAGQTYTRQGGTQFVYSGRNIRAIRTHAYYGADKTPLPDLGSETEVNEVTIPEGAKYIRICFLNVTLDYILTEYATFIKGTTVKDYVPYSAPEIKYKLKPQAHDTDYIVGLIEQHGGIPDGSITPEKIDNGKRHNLFANPVEGTNFWAHTFSWGGSRTSNDSYDSYRFAAKPNTFYMFRALPNAYDARAINAFDADGVYISGQSVVNTFIYKTSATTHFIECSFYHSLSIEDALNKFEIFEVVLNGESVTAFLPKTIYCAIGRTIEIYNEQICLNANKYHFQWVCSIGKALKRKFQITGTTAGETTLYLCIFDDNKNLLYAATSTLKVVAAAISEETSIVPLGDSLTNAKRWLAETERLSSNISFVGSYSWSLNDSEGVSHTGGHEGRSGFSAKDYATGAVYSYGGETTPNIWWNGSRFSFTAFKTTSGLNPDVIQIWLGVNGLQENNTANAGYIKTLVDNIRLDDANIPIVICNTIFKGNQNGIGNQGGTDGYSAKGGEWKMNEDFKMFDLIKRIGSLLSSYPNVHIVSLAASHDSEYNFGAVSTPVNPRATQTELMPIEAVHPQDQGYFQIADILFSAYCGILD